MKALSIFQSIFCSFMAIAFAVLSCFYVYYDKPLWLCCVCIAVSTVWAGMAGASITNTYLMMGED